MTTKLKAGDWVCSGTSIARIKAAYAFDRISRDELLDLVFYERDGTRIGRESPALGGPRGFEPMCSASNWRRILKPDFPLSKYDFLGNQVTFID